MKKFIVPVLLPFLFQCSENKKSNKDEPLTDKKDSPISLDQPVQPQPQPQVEPTPDGVTLDPSQSSPLSINFLGKVGIEDILCSDRSEALAQRGQIFTDIRFFIANLSLVDEQGKEVRLQLDVEENSRNLQYVDAEQRSLALLNFLDADCATSDATKLVKTAITGKLAQGVYKSLRFQLGLPYPAMAPELTAVPAALAPSDMGWMWQHYPADIQIEMQTGRTRKLLNALTSAEKRVITLPLNLINDGTKPGVAVTIDLAKLFPTTGVAFANGVESACNNSAKPLTEAAPNCAHAFKALGLEVINPKQPYEQSLFSIKE